MPNNTSKYIISPVSFSVLNEQDQKACIQLVVSGGAVSEVFVKKYLPKVKTLVLARTREDSSIVGIGAIKMVRPHRALEYARQSGFSFDENIPELGYVCVHSDHRNQKIACKIVGMLCGIEQRQLFATTSNDSMKRVLCSQGFEERGQSWGENRLTLWIKGAPCVR